MSRAGRAGTVALDYFLLSNIRLVAEVVKRVW